MPMQRWKWDAMHREVPGVEAHWIEDQTHAFCVSTQQSGGLVRHVALVGSGLRYKRRRWLCQGPSAPRF